MRLLITVEGGIIQGLTTDEENDIEVVVLDFDADGIDDVPEIKTYYTGRKEPCNIYEESIGVSKELVEYYFNIFKQVGV